MTDRQSCEHLAFRANVAVGRLSTYDGGPITHYCADITIACVACGQPMEFIGLPLGCSPYLPTVSIDGLELRAPLMPQGEKPPAGLTGYSITQSPALSKGDAH